MAVTMTPQSGCGYQSSACFSYLQPDCAQPLCFQNLHIGYDTPLATSSMSESQFTTRAYAEFAVAIDSTQTSYWSLYSLADGSGGAWTLEPLVFRADGNYRLYQIPLSALQDQGASLSYAAFQSGIGTVMIGAATLPGKTLRIDEFWIRW